MDNMDNIEKTDKNNLPENDKKEVRFKFLKKGEGLLASSSQSNTKFAQKRKEKVKMEQLEREMRDKTI